MLKRILIAALMWPLVALAGTYPSPTFQNLTVLGTFTSSGNVGLPSLASQAANTVVANITASSASPTAVAMPTCNTSSSALNYTPVTGFTCNTSINAATLGGTTFAAPGPIGSTTPGTGAFTTLSTTGAATVNSLSTGGASISGGTINGTSVGATTASTGRFTTLTTTSAYTPSSTAGIVGTTTNDNANAGSVGEYVTATAGPTSISSATNTNITSISLTAGDWDVWGAFNYSAAATTTTSSIQVGISSVSGTLPSNPMSYFSSGTFPTNAIQQHAVPQQRFSLSGTTTIYMVITATFATSTATAQAVISARRVR